MVAAIAETLTSFSATDRRFLLLVKRSCFNGQDIGRLSGKAEWSALLQVSASLADRILTLEAKLHAQDRGLEVIYASELTRERRHVLEHLEDRKFLRGVAMRTPDLVQKARRQAPSLIALDFAKPPAKWEDSLLRFITRAAAKLSANSTLTSSVAGSIRRSAVARGLYFGHAPQREVSLVRLKRPQLEQFQALLMCHPAVRRRSLVAWNDSTEESEPGRFRFVRDGHWTLEPDEAELKYIEPARLKVTPSNQMLLRAARAALLEDALRYDDLLARLATGLQPSTGGASDIRAGLEEFLKLGLLLLLPPWPHHEPWLERRISHFLHSIPKEELGADEIAAALAELVSGEEAFASAPRPEVAVVEMAESYSRLMHTVAPFAGHHGHLAIRADFFENVLCEAELDPGDDRGVFEIASSTVAEILRVVCLVSRFDGLFNLRHDVQHTLAAWWRNHAPARRQIPFNELAEGFAPIWGQFLKFFEATKESPLSTFDPLSSPALAALRENRQRLLSGTRELVCRSPAKDTLTALELTELLDTLPRRYAPLLGSSVFLQPTNPEGSAWVLNNVAEGTGRYLSRVVPMLEGSRRDRMLAHLTARSVINLEGEEADLLEVKYPWVHLVRVHPPQAARVLDLRGVHLDLPRERRLSLGDLIVQADLDAETFRLVDRSGRRVLPASLSAISDSGLPNRLRFLLMFGPGETRGVFPSSWSEGQGDIVAFNRLTCGIVVTRRRSWKIAVAMLRESIRNTTDRGSYVLVDKWRRGSGLPEEGYYHELARCGKHKPQFVRFDSPSLCRLFVSSIEKMEGTSLHFVESLPSPTAFPLNACMEPRAFELLIDQLAIRDPTEIPPWADRVATERSHLSEGSTENA
ncbi:MAG TPA: hypothetical protein DD490_21085 [Acidobacteria bacterium]|nr:hypothetical protein [Acidobacteriota bacterium]